MKKTLVMAISMCILFLCNLTLKAQDIIHRKNGKTLEVNVLEIADSEVKYKLFTQPDGVTFVMDASLIKKIVLANGTVHKFEDGGNFENKEYYEGQSKNIYKVSFLAPAFGFTSFGYERSIKPSQSFEARLGIIGLGRNTQGLFNSIKDNQSGAFVSLGYKFTHKPDSYNSRDRFSGLLNGAYIRPEISVGSYAHDVSNYSFGSNNATQRQQTTYACLMLCEGKQYVLGKRFVVDLYTGFGLGMVSREKNTNNTTIYDGASTDYVRYGNMIGSNNFAMTFGVNVGLTGK
jgi:hypothetical protein